MSLNIWQSILMGFVSGFTELLPVSAEAHRSILRFFMGTGSEEPLLRLVLHISALAALLWCCKNEIRKLRRTNALLRIPPRRRRHPLDKPSVYTLRLLRTAVVPLVIGRLLTGVLSFVSGELQILAFALLGNGVLLLIPSLVRNGNKDCRNMPRLDGILMGLGAALSVIPGFSQVGTTLGVGISRGVDKKYALYFAYLLLIPGLILHIVFDLLAIITGGAALTVMGFVGLLAAAVFCFAGSVAGYKLMNFLAFGTNFSAFSYYCFGAGLFCFVLFLTI